MILRKPYAFLIKYFKIIHVILFIICGFMLFKLRAIYVFFQDYVKTDTYNYIENIVDKYIGIPMVVASVLIFVSAFSILLLMKKKEKPVLFYRILILYSLGVIILLMVYSNFYKSLEFKLYDRATISIYRDIIGIAYYIMYFFVAVTFIRGFGFDIKKFSFEKDLKMLNITESDSEEFELSVNIDKENIANVFRKEKRFTKYFLKENLFVVLSILFIILLIIGFGIYKYYFVENFVYNSNEKIVANNIEYQINNTYLSNKDMYNQKLDNNYVIIDLTITNLGIENTSINLLKTKLDFNENVYFPLVNQNKFFSDLGIVYDGQELKPNVEYKNFILIFKVDDIVHLKNNVFLEIYESESIKNNELKIKYKKIMLDINELDDNKIEDANMNAQILIDNHFIKNVTFTLKNYEINNMFIHEYNICDNNKCNNYQKIIKSNKYLPILKIEYDLSNIELERISSYFSLIGQKNSMIKDKKTKLNLLYGSDKYAYFEIDGEINSYSFSILEINIRGNIYQINLI